MDQYPVKNTFIQFESMKQPVLRRAKTSPLPEAECAPALEREELAKRKRSDSDSSPEDEAPIPRRESSRRKLNVDGDHSSVNSSSPVGSTPSSPNSRHVTYSAAVLSAAPTTTGVVGRVLLLSMCPTGTRTVQNAFETAEDDDVREMLSMELRGHVWQAIESPYANYVIQQCILTSPAYSVQFIIDEIISRNDGACRAAQHPFGCRIIQRLLEHCPPEQVRELVDGILCEVESLVGNKFGNYVLQHIIEFGSYEQQQCLLRFIGERAHTLSLRPYSVSVVAKALAVASEQDVAVICQALLSKPGCLAEFATNQRAYIVVKLILEHAPDDMRRDAAKQLLTEAKFLSSNKFGRHLVTACRGVKM
jgi:hypothetical protein